MVKTVTPEAAVVVLCVYYAFLGTPVLSLALCILLPMQVGMSSMWCSIVLPLLALEILHFIYYVCLKTYFNHIHDLESVRHPRCDYTHKTRIDCWASVVEYAGVYGIREWITTWFGGRYEFEEIDAHSLMYLVRYIVLGHKGKRVITAEEERQLRPFTAMIEKEIGRGFRFRREDASAIKQSNTCGFEAIRSIYHPLWFYVVKGGLEQYHQRFVLRAQGFVPMTAFGDCHAYRQGCKVLYKYAPDTRPIVFIHGVGAGLFPYRDIVQRITLLGRTVVLVYVPHISMTHAYETPSNEAICELIQLSLANLADISSPSRSRSRSRKKVMEVDVVSNSFGTCIASTLIGRDRERDTGTRLLCRHMLLLDPVSIALSSPDLTARFVYDRRFAAVIDFMVRSEIHVMYSIQRRFDWMESFISHVMARIDRSAGPDCGRRDSNKQIIGPRINMKVYVASNDAMVNLEKFTRILGTCFQPQVEVAVMEGIAHGQWIAKEKYMQMVINDLSN